jgi:hypothetical protein
MRGPSCIVRANLTPFSLGGDTIIVRGCCCSLGYFSIRVVLRNVAARRGVAGAPVGRRARRRSPTTSPPGVRPRNLAPSHTPSETQRGWCSVTTGGMYRAGVAEGLLRASRCSKLDAWERASPGRDRRQQLFCRQRPAAAPPDVDSALPARTGRGFMEAFGTYGDHPQLRERRGGMAAPPWRASGPPSAPRPAGAPPACVTDPASTSHAACPRPRLSARVVAGRRGGGGTTILH